MEIVPYRTYKTYIDWYRSRIDSEADYVKAPLGVELFGDSGKLIAAVCLNQGWVNSELYAQFRRECGPMPLF